MTQYEQSLKEKWDWYSSMKTARDEGIKEGEAKGEKKGEHKVAKKIAKKLKDEGNPVDYIAEVTGLTEEEIKKF